MPPTDILESVKSGKKTPKSTSTKKNKKEVKEGVDEDVKEVANDLNKAMKQTESVNVSKFFDEDAVEYNEKESDEEEDEEKEENYSDAVSSLAPSVISIDPVQKFKEVLAISNNNDENKLKTFDEIISSHKYKMGEKANENIKTCYLEFFESASKRQEAFIDFLVLKLKSERSLKYRLDAKLKKIKNDEVDVD